MAQVSRSRHPNFLLPSAKRARAHVRALASTRGQARPSETRRREESCGDLLRDTDSQPHPETCFIQRKADKNPAGHYGGKKREWREGSPRDRPYTARPSTREGNWQKWQKPSGVR